MKEGWEYCLFKDVFPIKMGKTPPRGDSSSWDKTKETNNYWVSIADISQNEGKTIYDTKEYITDKAAEKIFKVKANSLLMSFKLSIGRMAFAGVDLYTNEAIIAIPESDDYNLRFLYYYLASYDWKTLTEGNEKVKGATLNKESIGKIKLPILSLAEQQQIVSFLDSEFEKIDALKANAETQLQAAKDLFQKALKELLTPKDGWVEKKINEVCQVVNGRAYKQDEMLATGKYRLLRVGNFFTNDNWYYSDLELDENKYCDNGDLLYAWSASFGPRIWHGEKVIYHYHIWKLICSNHIDKYYLFYWLDSDVFKKQVMKDLHGATMNHITKTIMEATIIKYPSIKEQQAIADNLDTLSAKVKQLQDNYAETITLCNDLKQSLLKKIFE